MYKAADKSTYVFVLRRVNRDNRAVTKSHRGAGSGTIVGNLIVVKLIG